MGTEIQSDKPTISGLIIFSLLVLICASGAIFYYFTRAPILDVWQETTVPYDPDCTKDCIEVMSKEAGSHGAEAFTMSINPNVDDPIAQWGDCVESILQCLEANTSPSDPYDDKAAQLRLCVSESVCPDPCKEAYVEKSQDQNEKAETSMDAVFTSSQALCRPSGGN